MFAAISRRGPIVLRLDVFCLAARASFVKRSEMALSCISGGRRMWTSGSRHRGSCMPSTFTGLRTRIGTSCVMIVSRSREPVAKSMPDSPSS
jgi:hypothetical protein